MGNQGKILMGAIAGAAIATAIALVGTGHVRFGGGDSASTTTSGELIADSGESSTVQGLTGLDTRDPSELGAAPEAGIDNAVGVRLFDDGNKGP